MGQLVSYFTKGRSWLVFFLRVAETAKRFAFVDGEYTSPSPFVGMSIT